LSPSTALFEPAVGGDLVSVTTRTRLGAIVGGRSNVQTNNIGARLRLAE
jgi:hypothetical protein